MSGKKSDLKDEDLIELYDMAYNQFKEDRTLILEVFNELRKIIKDNPERYALSGDTLAKFSEVLIKQTNQSIELIKVVQKQKEKDDSLTSDDYEKIAEKLLSDHKQQ